ncbi:MAG: hypothetical protein KF809_12060 [Chloroflexi bacterium]|nr:hypothetical protein [Chloroflexota bacterium]
MDIGSSPVFQRALLLPLPAMLAVLIVTALLLLVGVVVLGGIVPHPADGEPLLAPFRWDSIRRNA